MRGSANVQKVTRLGNFPYSSALTLQKLATPGLPSHADATDWYLECKPRIFSRKNCKYNLVSTSKARRLLCVSFEMSTPNDIRARSLLTNAAGTPHAIRLEDEEP